MEKKTFAGVVIAVSISTPHDPQTKKHGPPVPKEPRWRGAPPRVSDGPKETVSGRSRSVMIENKWRYCRVYFFGVTREGWKRFAVSYPTRGRERREQGERKPEMFNPVASDSEYETHDRVG